MTRRLRHASAVRALTAVAVTAAALTGCSNTFTSPNQKPSTGTQLSAAPPAAGDKAEIEQQLALAQLADSQGEARRAEQLYQELLRASPNLGPAHHGLALVYAKQKDFRAAGVHFEAARKLMPRDVALLNDLGYAYYLQNNLPEAEKVLREALREDAKNERAMNNLATVIGMQGRSQEAFDLFRQAGSEAQALNNLAFVHVQLAETDKAKTLYSRALDRDVSLRSAATGLAELARHEKRFDKALGNDDTLSPEDERRLSDELKRNLPPAPSVSQLKQAAEAAAAAQAARGAAPASAAPTATAARPQIPSVPQAAPAAPAPIIAPEATIVATRPAAPPAAVVQAPAAAPQRATTAAHQEPVAPPQSFNGLPWNRGPATVASDYTPADRASASVPVATDAQPAAIPATATSFQSPNLPALSGIGPSANPNPVTLPTPIPNGKPVVREWSVGETGTSGGQNDASSQDFVTANGGAMRLGTPAAVQPTTLQPNAPTRLPQIAAPEAASRDETSVNHTLPNMATATMLAPQMPDFPSINVPPPSVGRDSSPAADAGRSLPDILTNIPYAPGGVPEIPTIR